MSDGDVSVVVSNNLATTDDMRHFLPIILIVAPLGAMLVPVIGTLIAFTPAATRRRPVFILNVFSCLLGILQAVITVGFVYEVLTAPARILPIAWWLFKIASLLIPPVVTDGILLFRLLAFYPVQLTRRLTLLGVISFPIVVKIARVFLVVAFMATYPTARLSEPGILAIRGLIWAKGPLVIAIFALQVVDNSYTSSIFLYKLYKFRKNGVHILQDEVMTRLPSIFLIALGNYLFPVVMNLIQIALMTMAPGMIDGIYIIYTNNFVTILGAVFATVWTSKQNWTLRAILSSSDLASRPLSDIHFRRRKSWETTGDTFDPDEELGFWPTMR